MQCIAAELHLTFHTHIFNGHLLWAFSLLILNSGLEMRLFTAQITAPLLA